MVQHELMKLGKQARGYDPRMLRLARYVSISQIPEPPAVVENSKGITEWGMMLNDKLGCCTIAGLGHAFQVAVASVINPAAKAATIHPSDDIIVRYYEKFCGYNPADPSTDQGGVMLDVLTKLSNSDFAGRKIKAFVNVDPTDLQMIQIACWLFGGLYSGVQLPVAWQGKRTWDVVKGWAGRRGSWGGHCIFVPDSNKDSKKAISWGEDYTITNNAFTTYFDETWALLMEDWTPPKGFDMDMLEADLELVKA